MAEALKSSRAALSALFALLSAHFFFAAERDDCDDDKPAGGETRCSGCENCAI